MAKQSKAPNTRNKKVMAARAEAAAIASSKEFLRLKTSEAQLVYETYLAGVHNAMSESEIIDSIRNLLINKFNLGEEIAASVSAAAYDRCASGAFQNTLIEAASIEFSDADNTDNTPPPPAIKLTLVDYQAFNNFCHTLEDFSEPCKRLLLSLIVFYRRNYHPSNWVRYDRKNIFYLAGLHMKSAATQEALTQYLHKNCGLNMRVVGSNQPIVCYDFTWIHDQPSDAAVNPLLTLGPLEPRALHEVIAKVNESPDLDS